MGGITSAVLIGAAVAGAGLSYAGQQKQASAQKDAARRAEANTRQGRSHPSGYAGTGHPADRRRKSFRTLEYDGLMVCATIVYTLLSL